MESKQQTPFTPLQTVRRHTDLTEHPSVSSTGYRARTRCHRLFPAVAAVLAAVCGSTAVASMVTTQSFTYPSDQVLLDSDVTGVSESNYQVLDGSTDPTLTVQPFAGNPGDLISFTIWFDLTYDVSYQTGPDGGSITSSVGGNFFFDTELAGGNGDGVGNGGPPNTQLSESFDLNHSQTFLVSEAGTNYDPELLNLVQGASPFDLRYDHKPSISLSGTTDSFLMTLREGSSFGLSYTAIPEPATLLLFLGGALGLYLRRR